MYQFDRLYALLDSKEAREFGHWLTQSLGSSKEDVRELYRAWLATEGDWRSMPEKLGLYGSRAEKRLIRLRNDLQGELEGYLAWLRFRKDIGLQGQLLVQELTERNAHNMLPLSINKVLGRLNRGQKKDFAYHDHAYRVRREELAHRILHPDTFRKKQSVTHVIVMLHQIWRWKIEILEEAIVIGQSNAPLANHFNDALNAIHQLEQSLIPSGSLPKELSIALDKIDQAPVHYLEEYYTWTQRDQVEPFSFAESTFWVPRLQAVQDSFSRRLFATLHLSLTNCLLRKLRESRALGEHKLILDLFEWAHQDQIWPLSRKVYATISKIFLRTLLLESDLNQHKELEIKALEFLDRYRQLLPEEDAEIAYFFNWVSYQFALGQFQLVMKAQPPANFSDPFYLIQFETLKIQTAYELGDTEFLPEYIQRLKQKIQRSKTLKQVEKSDYKNRLNLILALLRVHNKEDVDKFASRLKETRPLSFSGRLWLEQKLSDLIE